LLFSSSVLGEEAVKQFLLDSLQLATALRRAGSFINVDRQRERV
jgi:hypothetical protein